MVVVVWFVYLYLGISQSGVGEREGDRRNRRDLQPTHEIASRTAMQADLSLSVWVRGHADGEAGGGTGR